MFANIKKKLLVWLLAKLLTEKNIKKLIDVLLGVAEKFAKKTETELDDKVIQKIRDALDIQ